MSHRRRRVPIAAVLPPCNRVRGLVLTWPRRRAILLIAVLGALLLAVALHAANPPTRQRGRLLNTKLLTTDHKHIFNAQLAPSTDGVPRVLLTKYDIVTFHEVGIYEVLLEFKAPDETDRGKIIYKVAEGETIRGEETQRSEEVLLGPCLGEKFTVLGAEVESDAAGIIADEQGLLLRLFDDLTTPETELEIAHETMGTVTLPLTRGIIVRRTSEATLRTRMKAGDILAAMGLDFCPATRSGHDDLGVTVSCPETVTPGQVMEITVEVENDGASHVSSFLGRTVSRHDWLNGRNFYIGSLAPGDTQSFTRKYEVPAGHPAGTVFLVIGMWDILGAMPDYNTPLQIKVTTKQ